MKRFIRYLYEYERGQRLRNVGFIKVEQGDRDCVLHIHGKGMRMNGEKQLQLYLFYEQEEQCVGIWQGTVENVNPAINYQLHYTKEDVGVPENFERIQGIILVNDSGQKYAAIWDDMPVNVENMRIWSAEEMQEETKTDWQEEDSQEIQDNERESIPKKEIPVEIEEQSEPGNTANFASIHCTKMQRNELAKLPRCEWKLANNRFLLHGYYNYHHLVLLEDGEKCRIGVPGVYHPKEARAAETFGFSEFITMDHVDVDLTEEERDDQEKFGYWCRYVRRPMKD